MTIVERTVSPRNKPSGAKTPGALGGVPPEAPPPGIASPRVSRCATLKASAATRTIARNRSSGTAHSLFPRHGRITAVRRRRALITVSGTASGAECWSGRAELLEEPLAAPLADEPQAEGDQAGCDRETERERSEADRPAEYGLCGARSGGVLDG